MPIEVATLAAIVGSVATAISVATSFLGFYRLKKEAKEAHVKLIKENRDKIELLINGQIVTIDINGIDREDPAKLDQAIRSLNTVRATSATA